MARDSHKKISHELRAIFIKAEYPIPFGLLDNSDIDLMPYSHKLLMADAFYRSWTHKQKKASDEKLFFLSHERGPCYKKYHYDSFLDKVFDKFERLGYIQQLGRSKDVYVIELDKILNARKI